MKLKIYDIVRLNTELDDLAERGISKSYIGTVLDVKGDNCFVRFINRKNIGDYACVNVQSEYLDFLGKEKGENYSEWEDFKKSDKVNKDRFKPQKFSEYNLVELVVEKEAYSKYGIHKGMRGVVTEDYCIDGEYYVIFTDENTAEDIADLCIFEDDLILIAR